MGEVRRRRDFERFRWIVIGYERVRVKLVEGVLGGERWGFEGWGVVVETTCGVEGVKVVSVVETSAIVVVVVGVLVFG